jgi:hypothetical protein
MRPLDRGPAGWLPRRARGRAGRQDPPGIAPRAPPTCRRLSRGGRRRHLRPGARPGALPSRIRTVPLGPPSRRQLDPAPTTGRRPPTSPCGGVACFAFPSSPPPDATERNAAANSTGSPERDPTAGTRQDCGFTGLIRGLLKVSGRGIAGRAWRGGRPRRVVCHRVCATSGELLPIYTQPAGCRWRGFRGHYHSGQPSRTSCRSPAAGNFSSRRDCSFSRKPHVYDGGFRTSMAS